MRRRSSAWLETVARPRLPEECDALRTYYARLDQIERNELDRVSLDEIQRFQKTRQRFEGNEFEVLFLRWKTYGDVVLSHRGVAGFLAGLREARGAVVTDQLPHSYDRFGTSAGVS